LFTASFEPRRGGVGAGVGEAMATCTIIMAPPYVATSSCLCCLWV